MSRTPAGARWISFHLFLPDRFDAFLGEALPPWLCGETEAGRVRRFFFIRYPEGGEHLRLRFLPPRDVPADGLQRRLADCVRDFAASGPPGDWVLERHPYDRTSLYFGETRASVYSELLNEATSRLALRLLRVRGQEGRGERMLMLAAVLHRLARRSVGGAAEFRDALARSRDFAWEAMLSLGLDTGLVPRPGDALAGAVLQSIRRAEGALEGDAVMERTVRLLARARRVGPSGRLVATHSLHLLCNKLGFAFPQEWSLFSVLCRLASSEDAPLPTTAPLPAAMERS